MDGKQAREESVMGQPRSVSHPQSTERWGPRPRRGVGPPPGSSSRSERPDMGRSSGAGDRGWGAASDRLGWTPRLARGRLLAGGAALAVAAGLAAGTGGAVALETERPPQAFEVAENGLRFAFAAQPVHEDGMPAYGNPFVTEGYIYPPGTLSGSNGVLADGLPEFPDKVIGWWSCRGYMIGDGAHTTTGPWVISTQTYSFGTAFGKVMLVTEGFELADMGEPITRAITGGTGPFRAARGEQSQTLLGFTEQMGVNLRVTLDVQPGLGGTA
jgi:hypothetical protein